MHLAPTPQHPPPTWRLPAIQPSEAAARGLANLADEQREILWGTSLMVFRLDVPPPPLGESLRLDVIPPTDELELSSLRWYTGGSLIDPRTPFQCLGVGLVGVQHDTPAALATGIPPP